MAREAHSKPSQFNDVATRIFDTELVEFRQSWEIRVEYFQHGMEERLAEYAPGQLFGLVMWESLWLVGTVASAVITIGPSMYLVHTGIDMSALLGGVDSQLTEVAGVGFDPTLSGQAQRRHQGLSSRQPRRPRPAGH